MPFWAWNHLPTTQPWLGCPDTTPVSLPDWCKVCFSNSKHSFLWTWGSSIRVALSTSYSVFVIKAVELRVSEECSEEIVYQVVTTGAVYSTETFWLWLGIKPSYQVWWFLQGLFFLHAGSNLVINSHPCVSQMLSMFISWSSAFSF